MKHLLLLAMSCALLSIAYAADDGGEGNNPDQPDESDTTEPVDCSEEVCDFVTIIHEASKRRSCLDHYTGVEGLQRCTSSVSQTFRSAPINCPDLVCVDDAMPEPVWECPQCLGGTQGFEADWSGETWDERLHDIWRAADSLLGGFNG